MRSLETKVAQGFRIETHTDTHAIIIVGGHRKPLWGRFRKHAAGSRHTNDLEKPADGRDLIIRLGVVVCGKCERRAFAMS